jgi:hypothetical protein
MFTRCTAVLALAAAALLSGCQQQTIEGASGTQPVAVLRHVTGSCPDLKFTEGKVINSAADVAALKCPALASESIDFSKQSVIVVALGERPSDGFWVRITGVQTLGNTAFVQYTVNRPGKGVAVSATPTSPFDAVIVSKLAATKVKAEPTSVSGQAVAAFDAPMAVPAPQPK